MEGTGVATSKAMQRLVRLVLSLALLISTAAAPLVEAREPQDLAPPNQVSAPAPHSGKTIEFDAEDHDGNPIHSTGAWATLTDNDLYSTPVLDGLENNDPQDPVPIFTTQSRRAEAEAFRQELLEKKNISADIVVVGDDGYALVERAEHEVEIGQSERTSAKALNSPLLVSQESTVQEKTLGRIQATFQAGASSYIYFSVGIHPVAAAAIVLFRTLITAHWAINARKVDTFFNKGLDVENHPDRSRVVNLFRRFVIDIGIGEATRLISGAYGHVHAVNSWAGQGEILKNVTIAAAASYILLFSRLKTFPDAKDRYVVPILGFCSFFPATVINLLDFSKMDLGPIKLSHIVTHIGNFDITVTNLLLFGGYASAAMAIHFFTPQTRAFAKWSSQSLEKLVANTSRTYEKVKNRILECRDSLSHI